jgi:hypothetical protein
MPRESCEVDGLSLRLVRVGGIPSYCFLTAICHMHDPETGRFPMLLWMIIPRFLLLLSLKAWVCAGF